MGFELLHIHRFRNILSASLLFSTHVNLILGQNGAGKTSILEALYMLGHGRSFRAKQNQYLIQHKADALDLYAEVACSAPSSPKLSIGIQRSNNKDSINKLNGEVVYSSAIFAKNLPMLLINPDSYLILDSGPKYRRQFIDWGLFHVEHSFFEVWKSAQKLLKQRNAALRQGCTHSEIRAWDEMLVKASDDITHHRENYVKQLCDEVSIILPQLTTLDNIHFKFNPGWDSKHSYAEALEKSFQRDLQSAYTHTGVHRADLDIYAGEQLAKQILSRGQQKMLVIALRLAQGRLLYQASRSKVVYLIDDMAAELDVEHRAKLAEVLKSIEAQVFVTAVNDQDVMPFFSSFPQKKMFHVEHGNVSLEP